MRVLRIGLHTKLCRNTLLSCVLIPHVTLWYCSILLQKLFKVFWGPQTNLWTCSDVNTPKFPRFYFSVSHDFWGHTVILQFSVTPKDPTKMVIVCVYMYMHILSHLHQLSPFQLLNMGHSHQMVWRMGTVTPRLHGAWLCFLSMWSSLDNVFADKPKHQLHRCPRYLASYPK